MNKVKKVAYYNMPGDVSYEESLLKEWNISDLELDLIKGNDPKTDLKGYQGLVTEYTLFPRELLKQLPDLKIISLQSIGYDEIDVKAAREFGIDVTNAPGYCAEDVALHAMALLLSLTRQIPLFNAQTHEGKWDCFAGRTMHRLSGKKAGLISFGNIPQKVAPMLKGFDIQVSAFDPGRSAEFMAQQGVEKCDTLEQLLETSDFVFLHTPLFPATYHMINAQTLAHMKPDALIINVSRGSLIDEPALIQALKEQRLAGAGLDVLEDEKNRGTELFSLPNVIITPHAGFLSEESLKQSRQMALKQLVKRLALDEKPALLVN